MSSIKSHEMESSVVAFTGTGATVEVSTNLSVITSCFFNFVGDAIGDATSGNTAMLCIDEVFDANGEHTVSGGAVTLKRVVEGSGTLTSAAKVAVTLIGKS